MRRVLIATLLLTSCHPVAAPVEPPPRPTRWYLTIEAQDEDWLCDQVGALKHCRTVGEVKAFLQSVNAN
jgi:hypothetical protein